MNIQPEAEILNIGEKKYRVMKLDATKYKKQTTEKSSLNMISYSGGGWRNHEDEPVCAKNREEKKSQIEKIKQQEKQLIQQYKEEQQTQKEIKQRYTHFISLPLNNPILMYQIEQIKEALDMDFLDSNRAHLTLLMLRLHDQQDIQKAKDLMNKLSPKIKSIFQENQNQTKLNLKGMGYFGKSEKQARVLYLKIQHTKGFEILKNIVDIICKAFVEQQIVDVNDMPHISYNKLVKMYEIDQMHITLMKSKKEGETYDFSKVIEQYEDLDIKNIKYRQIDISKMTKFQSNGYYEPELSCQFDDQS